MHLTYKLLYRLSRLFSGARYWAMRRFTRLTNGFSKKIENHCYAVAIHYMHYNWCRIHKTLRCTPAMAAGVSDHVWEITEMLDRVGLK